MASRDRPSPLIPLADFGDDADDPTEELTTSAAKVLPEYDDDPATEALDGASAGIDLPGHLQIVRALEPSGPADRIEVLDLRLGRAEVLFVAIPDAVEAFLAWRERRVRLDHPAVPPIHHAGDLVDGRPYLSLGPDVGIPIATWARSATPVAIAIVLIDAAYTLAAAHRVGLQHGSLSASQLLIDRPRRLQITGWSLDTRRAHGTDVAALAAVGRAVLGSPLPSRVERALDRFASDSAGSPRAFAEALEDCLRLG